MLHALRTLRVLVMSYWEKEIRSLMGKAIHYYGLIQDGDRIMVGVSGGKDSLALLHLLHERRKRVQTHYELIPAHIDLGFDSERAGILKDYFEAQGLSYHIEFTDIGKRANSSENRENSCAHGRGGKGFST
jgi:tRNA 2-thiocytidine biosynthesis protein TtcA